MNECPQETAWQQAYDWLSYQRRYAPANADVWHLRFHWHKTKDALYQQVITGQYRLTPMQRFETRQGSVVMWSACDALVLKWLTVCIAPSLPKHPRCRHLKGHGGVAGSLHKTREVLASGRYRFVFRTDIRGYYGHFPKQRLLNWLSHWVRNDVYLSLLHQYIDYTVEQGGEFFTPTLGICRGCSLSPLIGGSYLYHVDAELSGHKDIVYERYMDDFLVLSAKRWPLKRAIAQLNGYLSDEGFERHPKKTQIGRIENGFSWLGRWFTNDLEVVMKTKALL